MIGFSLDQGLKWTAWATVFPDRLPVPEAEFKP
jgi:hypothetical protein